MIYETRRYNSASLADSMKLLILATISLKSPVIMISQVRIDHSRGPLPLSLPVNLY